MPSRALCQCRYHRPSSAPPKLSKTIVSISKSSHQPMPHFAVEVVVMLYSFIDHYHIHCVQSGIPVHKKLKLNVIVLVTKDCWCWLGGSLHRHCSGLVSGVHSQHGHYLNQPPGRRLESSDQLWFVSVIFIVILQTVIWTSSVNVAIITLSSG